MKTYSVLVALALVLGTGAAAHASPSPSPSPAPGYEDVPSSHWAAKAVKVVGIDHDWMATGTKLFRPADPVTRREIARAMVRAFAASDRPDASIVFKDLPSSDPDYAAAAVAVKRQWLSVTDGNFVPSGAVTKVQLDKMELLALGVQSAVNGVNAIHSRDGTPVKHTSSLGWFIPAAVLGLHHNYSPDEQNELAISARIRRQDAAYAIARAFALQGGWQVQDLHRYDSLAIGNLTDAQRAVVSFALSYAGYPYVWGGEWHRATASSYCCGQQLAGGFDCSGFVWWVMRAPGNGWDNTAWRPYRGWALPERTSADMARATKTKIAFTGVRPLDLAFFDTDSSTSDGTGYASVDHVGISLGNGWMMHSSGSRGGVSIDWIGDGWWRDHFRWARRLA